MLPAGAEVYGDPEKHPQNEEYWGNVNPIGPRACYDESKRVAETLCVSYMHQGGVDVRSIRLFNTVGPRMAPDDGRGVRGDNADTATGKGPDNAKGKGPDNATETGAKG